MKSATLTIGIPCSGKSTWARQYCRDNGNTLNVNRDDLRFALSGHEGWSTYKFKRPFEDMVTIAQQNLIRMAAEQGKNVIISDTNLNEKNRNALVAFLESLGYRVYFKEFPIDLKTAYKRDASRPNGVGKEVIYTMYKQYLKYCGRRVYSPCALKPEAVIIDIDGTSAEMVSRGPFDWDKVGEDWPRKYVLMMVDGLVAGGLTPIFLSGRDGKAAEDTKEWLTTHSQAYRDFGHLYIREVDDRRPDTVFKEEVFWRDIADHYNVVMAIDDRPCMVRLWHEIGIKNVIAVADPYIEF